MPQLLHDRANRSVVQSWKGMDFRKGSWVQKIGNDREAHELRRTLHSGVMGGAE